MKDLYEGTVNSNSLKGNRGDSQARMVPKSSMAMPTPNERSLWSAAKSTLPFEAILPAISNLTVG